MLPAHRVIGHKEYGNQPPGGWPGRKTDPVYDMNWRRRRVAAFTPRGADPVAPSHQEADMYVYCYETGAIGVWNGGVFVGLGTARERAGAMSATNNLTRDPSKNFAPFQEVSQASWDLIDRRGQMLTGEKISPAVQAAVEASAAAQGPGTVNVTIDGEALAAAAPAIGEALAAANDRRARDGDPATGPVS